MFPVRYELGFYIPEDAILHRTNPCFISPCNSLFFHDIISEILRYRKFVP
jgi:hypothetical protein